MGPENGEGQAKRWQEVVDKRGREKSDKRREKGNGRNREKECV